LLVEVSTGNAGVKQRIRLELASLQSPDQVAKEIRKRLTTIARSRSFVDWQDRRDLVDDLEAQRRAIEEKDYLTGSAILATFRTPGGITVIKSALIDRISIQNPHLYRQDAEKIVNAILSEISAELARGDRVELRGFGVFFVKFREGRTGRNPRTGALVSVGSKAVPFFRSGKEMKSLLNSYAHGSDIDASR
jgi:integration host factor subunit beta